MKVLGRLKVVLLAFTVALVTSGASVMPVMAAEEVPKQRLQVSPAKLDVKDLRPGETEEVKFKVQNTGSENLKYELSVAPYSVTGDDYTQNFESKTTYTNIADWITFSRDEGEVEPDQQDEITAMIKVPKDVPAGGQYAAIMIRMLNNDGGSNSGGAAVSTINQIALVVYANVAGNTRKAGSVTENKVPSFMFTPPISATSVVENTGNVHAEAEYILQVYPFFGSEEVYTNEEEPEKHVIMPETRRMNTLSWNDAPHLGIFKVKQTVKFLDDVSEVEKIVFICPIWFLLIVLAVIFLIVFLIVSRVRGGRKE